ncbi:Dipeptide and tripeptide permease B [Candidatus Hepatincola sp. Av]
MTTKQKLPFQFWIIWIIELWERFGYYAVQGIIPYYFVKHLGYSESVSIVTFGSFSAFVYGFNYIGGWLGDHVIGAKRMIMIGAFILFCAYALLTISHADTVFYALGAIVVGNSLFKANPSSLISKMFEKGKEQHLLDSAVTLYYMAINVGSMISMIITPIVAQEISYNAAFSVAAIGLSIGLLGYLGMYSKLGAIGTPADNKPLNAVKLLAIIVVSLISVFVVAKLLTHPSLVSAIVWTIAVIGFIYFIYLSFKYKKQQRDRMLVALFLIACGILFFVLYNQQPTTLTFLAESGVDRVFFGYELPAPIYQVLNPVVIIVMSFVFTKFFYPYWKLSHSQKFAIGFWLSGIAFGLMYLMNFLNDGQGHVSNWFLFLNYLFQSTSELLISGLGIAMVAELCPRAMSGFVTGLWFVSAMVAGPVSAWVGNFTTSESIISNQERLYLYANTFGLIGLGTLIVGILLWVFSGSLNKIIGHGAYVE